MNCAPGTSFLARCMQNGSESYPDLMEASTEQSDTMDSTANWWPPMLVGGHNLEVLI